MSRGLTLEGALAHNAPALRWCVKKVARRLASLTGPAARMLPGPRIRVLTYHRFAHRTRDPFALAPDCFEAQMASLAASGCAIGLNRLLAFADGDTGDLPDHPVLVTIDDGAVSTLEVAAPILRRHAIPAVAFISSGRVGRPAGDEPERFLDTDEIRSLADFGIEIGSHAVGHVSLGALRGDALVHQLSGSKHALEALTGHPVRAFAYPFGTRSDTSPESREVAAQAGYSVCFTSQHGAITRRSDPHSMPRIKIEGGDPISVFERARTGGLDAWIAVDRALARFQATPSAGQPKAR